MCKKNANVVMFCVNIFSFLVGAILVIVGSLSQWGPEPMQSAILLATHQLDSRGDGRLPISWSEIAKITEDYVGVLNYFSFILLGIGCILAAISLVGLLAVCCRSGITIIINAFLTTSVLLLLVAFIVVLLLKTNQLKSTVGTLFYDKLITFYTFHNQTVRNITSEFTSTDIIDLIQIRANCCGSFSGRDYGRLINPGNMSTPYSCCIINGTVSMDPVYRDCSSQPTTNNSYFHKGCSSFITNMVTEFSLYVTYTFAALTIVLFIVVVMVSLLLRNFEE